MGFSKTVVRSDPSKRKPFDNIKKVLAAPYPCPLCGDAMYVSERIDFSSVQTPTGRLPKKHHRTCRLKLEAEEAKKDEPTA